MQNAFSAIQWHNRTPESWKLPEIGQKWKKTEKTGVFAWNRVCHVTVCWPKRLEFFDRVGEQLVEGRPIAVCVLSWPYATPQSQKLARSFWKLAMAPVFEENASVTWRFHNEKIQILHERDQAHCSSRKVSYDSNETGPWRENRRKTFQRFTLNFCHFGTALHNAHGNA